MMNWEKHRFTKTQRRLVSTTREWQVSDYGGPTLEGREVLRWHLRLEKQHPAYRRWRKKHPAFYSIRYIRSGKIQLHKRAWFRFRKTPEEQKRSLRGRRRRHPLLQISKSKEV